MLGGGDKPDPLSRDEGDSLFQDLYGKVHGMEVIDDTRPFVDWGMTYVDQSVSKGKDGEGQVTGTVAWVATHDHLEACFPEAEGELRGSPLEPLGELDGDTPRTPLPEIPDQIREIFQRYAPGS